jgi:hypothetical protein
LDWKLEENQQLKRDGGRKKSTGWIDVSHLSQHDNTYDHPSGKNDSKSPNREGSQAVGPDEPKKANALDNILKNAFSHDIMRVKPRASVRPSFQESVDYIFSTGQKPKTSFELYTSGDPNNTLLVSSKNPFGQRDSLALNSDLMTPRANQ